MNHDKIKNMRFFSLSFLVFLFFLQPVNNDEQLFRVVRVLDGDTIEIIDDKDQTTRIRFDGIDAP